MGLIRAGDAPDHDQSRQLVWVDCSRGLAILAVMAVHVTGAVLPTDAYLHAAALAGTYGVQLFYVISAYTLFRSFKLRSQAGGFSFMGYGIRRFARIAPMWWLALVGWLALHGLARSYWAPSGITPTDVGMAALFLHGLSPTAINSVVAGGWSVADEMPFYLLLPLAFRLRSLRAALLTVAATLIGGYIVSWWWFLHALPAYPANEHYLPYTYAFDFWLPAQLPVFATGIALFFIGERLEKQRGLGVAWMALSITLIVVAAGRPTESLVSPRFVAGIAFLFLCLAAMSGDFPLFRSRVLAHVGRVSFSAYLVQFWAIDIAGFIFKRPIGRLGHNVGYLAMWLLSAAVCVAIATVTDVVPVLIPFRRRVLPFDARWLKGWQQAVGHTPQACCAAIWAGVLPPRLECGLTVL